MFKTNYKMKTCKYLTIPASCAGYTILEILAVVIIMGLCAVVSATMLGDKTNRKLTAQTLVSMQEIKMAILGTTSDRVKGNVKFAGFVQDIGSLPALCDVFNTPDDPADDQPLPLWDFEAGNFKSFRHYYYLEIEYVSVGWRGPYLKPPSKDTLVDGWQNLLIFQITNNGDFIITSLGADNCEGGNDFDRDITFIISKKDYTGTVAGYVSPILMQEWESLDQNYVRIYYTAVREPVSSSYSIQDCLGFMETIPEPDGYFRFEGVPVGTQRLLLAGEKIYHYRDKGYKIAVEPGALWLGTPGLIH